MKTVPSVFTLFMKTIYLSRITQVAKETVFSKHFEVFRLKTESRIPDQLIVTLYTLSI